MPMFEERERAFEAKYAHDQEARFLQLARRDKLFASRVAGQLRLSDHEAGELTTSAIALADGPGHDSKLLDLMASVMAGHNHSAGRAELTALLDECGKQVEQLHPGVPPS